MPKLTIPTVAITKSTVERAAPGTKIQDKKEPKLRLIVSPKGKAIWQFYGRNPATGLPVTEKLGDAGDDGMAVEVARDKATAKRLAMKAPEAKAEAAAGKAPTLGAIVDRKGTPWLSDHIDKSFKDWREIRLDAITPQMVNDREEDILKRARAESLYRNPDQKDPGRATLGLAAKALRQVYNYAREKKLHVGENLGLLLPLYKGEPRRVWLKDDKLGRLLDVLGNWERNGLPKWAKPYYTLQVVCGTRGGILAKARWEWIDWATQRLVIPASEAKNRKQNVLHLNPDAVAILKDWQTTTAERASPFVFPSVRDAYKSMTNMHGMGWVKVRDLAKLGDTKPHDLRRTFGSRLLNAGQPLERIAKLLNNSLAVAQLVYAHHDDDVLRQAVAAAPLPKRAVA